MLSALTEGLLTRQAPRLMLPSTVYHLQRLFLLVRKARGNVLSVILSNYCMACMFVLCCMLCAFNPGCALTPVHEGYLSVLYLCVLLHVECTVLCISVCIITSVLRIVGLHVAFRVVCLQAQFTVFVRPGW
jgi:hypothetical protein